MGLFIVGMWAVILVPSALAQYSSVFEGTVTDQSGAPVPNAKIVVTNQATNVTYPGNTTTTGTFRIAALPAGSYKIQVQAPGFNVWTQMDIVLEPNKIRTVNPELALGAQQTTVQVRARGTSVETGKTEAARTVGTTSITDAPMPLRNIYVALAAIAPGVTGTGADLGNTATATPDNFGTEVDPNINAAGKRYETNFYYVDGSPVNVVSMGGTIVIQPEPDTVSEMKITAVDFSADVGRGSGATIQVFTKSGSNRFHGNLSEFHTDNALTSRTEFETGKLPATRRNEFGGTIGGPIVKDKTFFFGSVFFMRSSRASSHVTTVETPEFANYVQQNFPNNLASTFMSSDPPATPPSINFLTAAEVEAENPGHFAPPAGIPPDLPVIGTTFVNNVVPRNGHQWHFRIDHNLNSDKDRIYLSNYNTLGTDSIDDPRPKNWLNTTETSWLSKLDWVHTISPSLLNEAGITYLRTTGAFISNVPNLPTDYVTGVSQLGQWGGLPWAENDFDFHDTISWMHGSHNLRIGYDLDHQTDFDLFAQDDARPSFTFANLLDFAQDLPIAQSGPAVYTPTLGTSYDYLMQRILYMGPFIQDDWKVTRRFTVNLGLRYDYFGHLGSLENNHVSIPKWIAGSGSTFVQQVANGSMKDWGNGWQIPNRLGGFAPRVGFGWDVFGNGSTAVRGGYGIFYDRYGNEAYRTVDNPPLWVTPSVSIFEAGAKFSYSLAPFSPPPGFTSQANPAGGIVGTLVSAQGVQPNIGAPTTHQWMGSIQHTMGHDILIEGDYYGTHASHMLMIANVNRVAGDLIVNNGVLKLPNPYFGSINYSYGAGISDSDYASVMINKRMSKSYAITGVFTFGKATDDNSSFGTGAANSGNVVDAAHPSYQHGRADFSVGNRLSIDSTFIVPDFWGGRGLKSKALAGWRLEEIGILQSGLPYSVYCSAPFSSTYQIPGDSSSPLIGNAGCDYNGDGFDYDFPNPPSFGNSKSGNRSAFLNGLYTASQFPAPPLGQEGALGRNTFTGPGLANFNTEFAKASDIPWFTHEAASLEFRADIFNLFNRVNLGNPVSDMASSLFGHSVSQQMPRTVQFGIYFKF